MLFPERTGQIMNKNIKKQVMNGDYIPVRFGKDQQLAMGKRIRELREESGLAMGEIAEVLGISDDMMGRLENGRSTIRTEHIFVLAQLFDVSAHYIMFGKDERILTEEIDKLCFGKNREILCKAYDMLTIMFR